jgi:hypothetical protein
MAYNTHSTKIDRSEKINMYKHLSLVWKVTTDQPPKPGGFQAYAVEEAVLCWLLLRQMPAQSLQ